MKRSNEPFFWLLFGVGGMLAALIGPVLILVVGILAPLHWLVPAKTLTYQQAYAFAAHPFGKLVVFAVIALLLWHGVLRMGETLRDFLDLRGAAPQAALRGLALLGTGACIWLLAVL
jgi:fumarate reductase subunit D